MRFNKAKSYKRIWLYCLNLHMKKMTEEEKYYHEVSEKIEGSEKSQMFGKPFHFERNNKKLFC